MNDVLHDVLGNTVALSALLGLATPWLTAVLEQPGWPPRLRQAVAVVAAVVVAVIATAARGEIGNGGTLLSAVVVVLGVAQASYHELYMPNAAVRGAVRAVEETTAVSGRAA